MHNIDITSPLVSAQKDANASELSVTRYSERERESSRRDALS